jgi:hypothetical protein
MPGDFTMKRFGVLLGFCGLFLTVAGCGPMRTTLPVRLDDEGQKKIDESWNKAFADLGQIDHQQLLDIFVGTGAYQLGVDKLYLRSEKRTAGGLVVMEINFDRAAADQDRFEVSAFDPAGKLIRSEKYNRKEVEQTHADLFPPAAKDGKQQEEHKARWDKIVTYFPKEKEKDDPNVAKANAGPKK